MLEQDREPGKQPTPESTDAAGPEKPAGGEPEKKCGARAPKAPGAKHRAGDRARKQKKMPKSLILGLVIGGLAIVSVIVVLASTGGLSKEELEAAKTTFRSLLANCLENNAEAGIPRLDVQLMLRYEKPDEFKKWKDLTPEQRTALAQVAFDSVREKVGRMGVKNPAEADALLAGAAVTPESRTMQVQYEMKVGEVSWNAALSKRDTGWQLVRLDPIN